jgi:hypothetical protein
MCCKWSTPKLATSQTASAASSISNTNDPASNNNIPDDNKKDNDKKKTVSLAAAMAGVSLLERAGDIAASSSIGDSFKSSFILIYPTDLATYE